MTPGAPRNRAAQTTGGRCGSRRWRSKLATTSAAESAVPSWKRTLSRRVKVQVSASRETDQRVASAGSMSVEPSFHATSVSKTWRATSAGAPSSAVAGSTTAGSPAMPTRTSRRGAQNGQNCAPAACGHAASAAARTSATADRRRAIKVLYRKHPDAPALWPKIVPRGDRYGTCSLAEVCAPARTDDEERERIRGPGWSRKRLRSLTFFFPAAYTSADLRPVRSERAAHRRS